MTTRKSAAKGKGTLFPVDNWGDIIIFDENQKDDDYSFKYQAPADIGSHLLAIHERCLSLVDKKDIDHLQFLEAFHSSVIASYLAEKIQSGVYDIGEVVALAVKLGELSTIARYRSAEHEYASGVNMKSSSKKATQAVTKIRPTKPELKRVLTKLRKIHEKETRVIVEAAKHFRVGKSTLYKWKSELEI